MRAEIIAPHRFNVTAAAEKLHVTRRAMRYRLDDNAGVSAAEMAIRFERACGLRADTMLRMQAAHDLAVARSREGEILVERVAA